MSLDKAIEKLNRLRRKVKREYPEAYKVTIETDLEHNDDFLPRVTVYYEETYEDWKDRVGGYKKQQELFKQARYNNYLKLKEEFEEW